MSTLPPERPQPPPAIDASVHEPIPGLDMDALTENLDLNDPFVAAMAKAFADEAPAAPQEFLNRTSNGGLPAPVTQEPAPVNETVPPPVTETGAATDAGVPGGPPASEPLPPPTTPPVATEPPTSATTPTEDKSAWGDQTYNVPLGDGTTLDLSLNDIQQLIGLNQYFATLSDEQRQAMLAVEQGQAIAVPQTDYQRFQEWQRQQEPAQPAFDPEKVLDPELAKYVQSLQGEVQQLKERVSSTPDPNVAIQQYSQHQQILEANRRLIDSVAQRFATENQLTPDEMDQLTNFAAQRNYASIYTAGKTNPAEMTAGIENVFRAAANDHPVFRQRMIDNIVNQRLAAEREQSSATELKKARSASLASAPSAAVTAPQRDLNKPLDPNDMEAQMANFLRQAMNEGSAAQ